MTEQDIFDELKYDITIDIHGSKIYQNHNGEIHRDGGPAYIDITGYQAWYRNGELHRIDGPARIWSDGTQYWYLNGIRYSKEEWEDEIRTRFIR
jgi:hypothetical protein